MRHSSGWARGRGHRRRPRRLVRAALLITAGAALAAGGNALAAVAVGFDRGGSSDDDKVAICHKPGTDAEHTLRVSRNAVDAHLGQGDYVGECAPSTTTSEPPPTTTSEPPPTTTSEPPPTTTTAPPSTTTETTTTTEPPPATTTAPPTTTTTESTPPETTTAPGTAPLSLPDLRLSVDVSPASGSVGQEITFTYRVRNVGMGPARDVEVRAEVPLGATLVSVAVARSTVARRRLAARLDPACTSTGIQVTCVLGTLAPGASGAVTMIVTPTASGPLFSAASAVSAEATTSPAGGSAEIVDAAGQSPNPPGTPDPSPVGPQPPGPASTLPPPTGGVSANVIPVAGTVLVNGVPLQQGEQLPLGVPIDTTNGIAQVITIGPNGQPQAAFFFSGVFTLRQPAPTAVTDVVLEGGDQSVCALKKSKRALSAKAPKAKRTKKVIRSLWGQGTGSFRTRGKYSSATVRGTFWLTADRCDGTLTRVEEGSVTVRDVPKKKTVIVTAGHSYLAAAP